MPRHAGATTPPCELDPTDGCTFWFTTEYLQSDHRRGLEDADRIVQVPELHGRAARRPDRHGHQLQQRTSRSPVRSSPRRTESTTTDDQGHYELTLPTGTYDVTVLGVRLRHRDGHGRSDHRRRHDDAERGARSGPDGDAERHCDGRRRARLAAVHADRGRRPARVGRSTPTRSRGSTACRSRPVRPTRSSTRRRCPATRS